MVTHHVSENKHRNIYTFMAIDNLNFYNLSESMNCFSDYTSITYMNGVVCQSVRCEQQVE